MKNKITILGLMILGLSACSHDISPGEQMLSHSEETKKLGDRWNEGKESISKSHKLHSKGSKLIKKGKQQISEGEKMVSEGKKLIDLAESTMKNGERLQSESEATFKEKYALTETNKS